MTAVFQRGVDGYNGVTDSLMNGWATGTNYGTYTQLFVRSGGWMAPILRFDVSSISAGSSVLEATLSLYVSGSSNAHPLDMGAYRIRRSWTESQVTWNQARSGVNWGIPGAEDTGTDRYPNAVDSVQVQGISQWVDLDVTSLVQDWIANPAGNKGLTLKSFNVVGVQYNMPSSDYWNMWLRPKLTVRYVGGGVPPTATNTPVPPTATWTPTSTSTGTSAPPTMTPTPTPTQPAAPTATPGGSQTTAVFQRGLNGYDGVTDGLVNAWSPSTNYGTYSQLFVRSGDWMSTLMRFDLGSIPAGSEILEARLELYATGSSNSSSMEMRTFEMRRNWDEARVTWNQSVAGTNWGKPGANDTTVDRYVQPVDAVQVSGTSRWVEVDILDLVQGWVSNPGSNRGFVLKSFTLVGVQYNFTSSEFWNLGMRPKLTVRYTGGGTPPTATNTPIPPTPTFTPTHTPAATNTMVPATATWTPTPAPTATPGGAETTAVFQRGTQGYDGVTDSFMNGWSPDTNYGTYSQLFLRSGGWMAPVLRFELGSIPAGSIIWEATLSLYATGSSNSHGLDMEAYRLRRAWAESNVTWNQAASGVNWGQPGAEDTNTDRYATVADSVPVQSISRWVDLDVTALAQDWVSNPAGNVGVTLKSFNVVGVQYNFTSSEFWNVGLRPKLTVRYIAGSGEPTATPTPAPPTATWTPTPAPTTTPIPSGGEFTASFQRGNNDYNGVKDSFLNGWSPDTNNGSYTKMWLRSGEWMEPVLRFDLSSIPGNATVKEATLSLYVESSSNDYTVEVRGYRLIREWNESEVTWNKATNGQPWGQPGANEAGTDRAWTHKTQAVHSGTGAWLNLEVRALTQNWVSAPEQNAGIILKGIGSAGVRYDLLSSEFWNVGLRPKLTITYQLP